MQLIAELSYNIVNAQMERNSGLFVGYGFNGRLSVQDHPDMIMVIFE